MDLGLMWNLATEIRLGPPVTAMEILQNWKMLSPVLSGFIELREELDLG